MNGAAARRGLGALALLGALLPGTAGTAWGADNGEWSVLPAANAVGQRPYFYLAAAPGTAVGTPSPSPTAPTGPAPSASTPPTPTTPPATAASPCAAPTNRAVPPPPGPDSPATG
ncbi:hypothetical protein ACFSNO_32185 [Streptomyces cirratus]